VLPALTQRQTQPALQYGTTGSCTAGDKGACSCTVNSHSLSLSLCLISRLSSCMPAFTAPRQCRDCRISDKWGGLSIPSPVTCHVESYCPKPRVRCEWGSTALHVACANGNQEAVALLLAHGARTDLANEYVVLIVVIRILLARSFTVVAHVLGAQRGHDAIDGGLSPRPRGRCFGPACHCTGWDQSAAGQHGAHC
jgi:hypothetical protein